MTTRTLNRHDPLTVRLRTLRRSYHWDETTAEEILEGQHYTCAICSEEPVDIYSPVHRASGFVCESCSASWRWSLRDAAARGEYRGPARPLYAEPRRQVPRVAAEPSRVRRRTGMPRLPGDAQ